ncbi:probable salivary secreted peptide [Odontomachus brunneus]|uniref:probable salivary secreted peptide n=1 Tax=Odontomachus brunneus TaxID=486640 RepID=UPI0013F229C2|nr:probable salivary secreted peptide [Odontomachus brunneus]
MSAYKHIIAVSFLVVVLLALSVAENKSHNLTVGYRMPGDRLVLTEKIVKNSAWLRIVTVEKTFNTTRYERITYIEALDQKTNGNGAYASILSGGPGNTNVTMKFKSQRGHGIDFVFNMYARP